MNKNQKKTLYLFLSLYLISSYILLSSLAYIYYQSKKQLLHTQAHFMLHEEASKINTKINDKKGKNIFSKEFSNKEFSMEFIDHNLTSLSNPKNTYPKQILNTGSFDIKHTCLVVKKNIFLQKNIWGFVLTDKTLSAKKEKLKINIIFLLSIMFLLVAIFGYILSILFLKPINNYIKNLDNFIKDANHELNTPITSLIIASKELDKTYNNRLTKSIIISTKQLYEIYKTLIDINFERKDNKRTLELKDIILKSIEYFNEILISKSIKINTNLHKTTYFADQEKMQRILNNLISNAIKYSYPNSTIKITLQDNTITIENYGIGIKKNHKDIIFKRYYKENRHHSKGLGIGLDVVRKICDEYNIEISVESKENINTIFTLKL